MKYYVIIFDRELSKSYKQFHEDFTNDQMVNKWWHYIKTMYIVGTNNSASDLSIHVRECFENNGLKKRHLILSVDLADRQGWLPTEAWDWIKRNS